MSSDRRKEPTRVLQMVAPGRYGGLETVVRQLASGLARRGHQVHVACRLDERDDPAEHPVVSALRREGVPVETIQLPHRAYRREITAFASLIRRFDADVVHTHGYHADVVGARATRKAGVPRVATAHGFTGGGLKNRFYEYLQRRSYRSAEAVIAVSEPLVNRLASDSRVAPAVRHLPNAWVPRTDRLDRASARSELGLDPDGFVAGWVGRMSREKGPDVAVAALSDSAAAGLTLCMVGDGPLRGELGSAARNGSGDRAGGGARVVWAGAVPDAGRLFAAFDALVLSSRTEGTPMVLFEAMDAEVPIVACRVGGVPDVVGSEEALLVEPEDPAALRRALLTVVGDPEAARERAERAAARLRTRFDPEAWLDAHEAVYREAIASAGAAGEGS